MSVNTISTEVLINHLRDTLGNPDNKICFILGAGASVESGISSGSMLARQWYNELSLFHSEHRIAQWKEEVGFDEQDIPAFYSKLFRLRYDGHRDDGIHYITNIIEKGSLGFGYTILSQVLQRTPHNVVITTNFDTLTEESLFVFTNKRALVCNHENIAHLARPSSTRPLVVKIHRGLYMDPLNDQDEIAHLKEEWKKALTNIFHNYIPIVIGYGGNDGSLMNYLGSIEPCKRLYWCLSSEREPRTDIVKIVQHHNGTFVTTGGFNRLMFRFIDLFGLTKMHDVLEKLARERAEKLRSEFEEAGKDIAISGTVQEKTELGRVAEDFDTSDWLQWELKTASTADPAEKKTIYLKALSVLPGSHQLQYNLGYWLVEWGEYDDAIVAYKKALEIKPDYHKAWYNLGIAHYNKGEYDQAIMAYKKAVEIKPDKEEAWYNLGIIYDNQGEYEQAVIAYRKAVEIKPDDYEAWYNLGIVYDNLGEYEQAIIAYHKAVEIKPDYYQAWYNMGNSYRNKGEYEQAVIVYPKAVEIKPDYYQAWFNMGLSYKAMTDIPNARKCFEEALRLDPENSKYKKTLDELLDK